MAHIKSQQTVFVDTESQRDTAWPDGTMVYCKDTDATYVLDNSVFITVGDIVRVQPGTNTYTGGTATRPTVNISAATLNTLTVSGITSLATTTSTTFSGGTVSGGTFYSGSTPLQTYFNTINNQIASKANLSGATFTGTVYAPSLSATTLSGGTIYSGSTPLSSIITSLITGTSTSVNIKDGTNTYTGGSASLLSVNISAATLDHLTVTGNTILVQTTGTTLSLLNSGTTSIIERDYSANKINPDVRYSSIVGGSGNTINANLSNVQILGGNNISGTTNNHAYTSNFVVTGTSMGNLYATNIYSGSTNISTMFGGAGSSTAVQAGSNIATGGTQLVPIISTVASPSFNSITASGASVFTSTLSAATLSASTMISGSTNLYNIFSTTDTNDITRVQPGSNITTGGTDNFPVINVVDSPSFSSITASGSSVFNSTLSAGTFSATSAFVTTLSANTLSAATIYSASTNLYNIFATSTGFTPETIYVALSDETTQITTGTNKVTIYAPYAFNLTDVKASLSQSGSTTITTFNVKLTGTTIFSTKSTIDINEFSTSTAATPRVITASTIPVDSKITFDIDTIGTGCAGAKIYLLGYRI
jgi:hypothetical protein